MLAKVGGVFEKFGKRTLAAVAAGVCCLAFAAVGHANASGGGVLKVRLGGDRTETRIVIDLDRSATGRVASDGQDDRRVVMNLPGVNVDRTLQGAGQGLVKTWMLDGGPMGARLRIDLASDAVIKRRFLLPPADGAANYRYVIDLAAATPAAAGGAGRVMMISAPAAIRPPPLSLKKTVVIDAGHGGKDPGAIGSNGYEKDVTLAAALALKARLERTGRYRVVMTRSADVYVPLETRVPIARKSGADLFISLHADSGPTTSTRGASVYTLADRAVARSAKLVSKDDWFMKAGLQGDRGVSGILFDLTQRSTKNRSAKFAEMLLDRISNGDMMLLRRSHREAGLAVLLAPDVPAVLLEMGFVNNAEDEAFLRDPAGRARLMNAVGDSIDAYFAQETRLASR
ncbi:MAG: N-acetylmuramoyl-L-alanine amidase [Caulobacter sp.]|nr:N-acetylmuramoyl-L-alanine amidase [Caulobacter sp.]